MSEKIRLRGMLVVIIFEIIKRFNPSNDPEDNKRN